MKTLTDQELKQRLTPEEYAVLRKSATERPFSGEYWDEHTDGMYHCKACDAPLFSSDAKFDSGTGWPSFDEPANTKNIQLVKGKWFGMPLTEVRCKACGSHLGHLFDDGPTKTGKRYCINSCALDLKKENPR